MSRHVFDDYLGYGQTGDVQVAQLSASIAQRVYETMYNVGRVLDA